MSVSVFGSDPNKAAKRRSLRLDEVVSERVKFAKGMVDKQGQKLAEEIKDAILACVSHKDWKGAAEEDKPENAALLGVWATYRFDASAETKSKVQVVGLAHGCHTCLTVAASDTDQPWTGDHNPPTELPQSARAHLGCRSKTYLFPQCKRCSNEQASIVSRLSVTPANKMQEKVDSLTDTQKKLLLGKKAPVTSGLNQNCIEATGSLVSTAEGLLIQNIGMNVSKGGCHTCGTMYPCPDYVADHVVPKFLVSEGFRQLFLALDIALPKLAFRPQCQDCSNKQGGGVAQLATRAREYGRGLGIVFDEDPSARTTTM